MREYAEKLPFSEAVEAAVEYCIRNGILTDFLLENKSEAIAVSIFEYDEEKHLKSEREYAYHVGKEEGEKMGLILAFLKVGYPKEKILLELQERYTLSREESEACFEEIVKEGNRQN